MSGSSPLQFIRALSIKVRDAMHSFRLDELSARGKRWGTEVRWIANLNALENRLPLRSVRLDMRVGCHGPPLFCSILNKLRLLQGAHGRKATDSLSVRTPIDAVDLDYIFQVAVFRELLPLARLVLLSGCW